MHTNDVLTGLRLYLCVKLDTLFTNRHANSLPAHTRTERQARIIPSDAPYLCVPIRVGARWGTPRMTALEAKMSLFWAIFGNANCFSRSFSATAGQTGPLRACHNTTQQALSTQLYSFASTPSLPDLDEKSKSRLPYYHEPIDHVLNGIIFQFVHAFNHAKLELFSNLYREKRDLAFGAFCLPFAMHGFFQRIDKAAYREQMQQVAEHLKEHPPPRAITPPPLQPVGRPKLKRSAEQELAEAAAADAFIAELPQLKRARGKYTRWFDSPYINDILVAFARHNGSARRTVQSLQQNAPDDRFERLSHSSVASWFENGKLKERHQQELDAGRAASRGGGRCPSLLAAPGAEDEICDILLKLRAAGTPLNSHIIRWVMLAVLEDKHPAVLATLTLSQAYISNWVRANPRLQFRWRARTTAASKLPDDWEEQGIHMAQRMGAAMQMHKVSDRGHTALQAVRNTTLLTLVLSVHRFTLLSSSTWIRPAFISFLLRRGRMKCWAAALSLLSELKTSDRSQCAFLRLCEEICCRCSVSSRGRPLVLFLLLLLLPSLRELMSHTAPIIGARRRRCSAGSRMFCFLILSA